MKKLIYPLIIITLFYGCTTTKNSELLLETPENSNNDQKSIVSAAKLTTEDLQFPLLSNTHKNEFELYSIYDGIVKEICEDELGYTKIVVETKNEYYYIEDNHSLTYDFIYGGLKVVSSEIGREIKKGDYLGIASGESYITAIHDSLNEYMLRMTDNDPMKYNGKWYYAPNWIIQGNTAWLTFRPVNNFSHAVSDFYNRWAIEENPPLGSTIHYFHNLDRIRAKVKLNNYPINAKRDSSIKLVENTYYSGKEIFVLETVDDEISVDDHKVIIYWQKNFDNYLNNEYELGDDLYIYASIYAIDHDEKEILVCVRDFSLKKDEDIVNELLFRINE